MNNKKNISKPGLFARIIDKIDKKLVEKANQGSCCQKDDGKNSNDSADTSSKPPCC
ncbi:MAG: hypothetical protein ACN4E2_06530 [Nitrospinota bacterium]